MKNYIKISIDAQKVWKNTIHIHNKIFQKTRNGSELPQSDTKYLLKT
jgi:hypothetical protein